VKIRWKYLERDWTLEILASATTTYFPNIEIGLGVLSWCSWLINFLVHPWLSRCLCKCRFSFAVHYWCPEKELAKLKWER
jgi:hypothetical protein